MESEVTGLRRCKPANSRADALSFPSGFLSLVRVIHIRTESLTCTANKVEHTAVFTSDLTKWACFLKESRCILRLAVMNFLLA